MQVFGGSISIISNRLSDCTTYINILDTNKRIKKTVSSLSGLWYSPTYPYLLAHRNDMTNLLAAFFVRSTTKAETFLVKNSRYRWAFSTRKTTLSEAYNMLQPSLQAYVVALISEICKKDTRWGPSVIRWFINPINYSNRYHKT